MKAQLASLAINSAGVALIKSFESCRLTAYKAVSTEKYYTIGWGHYGADVKKGMTITQVQADAMFLSDIAKYEQYTRNALENANFVPNSNQFSALVSFCYNCGAANVRKLVRGRNASEVVEAMPLYRKSGGVVLKGLVRRRTAEVELFNKAVTQEATQTSDTSGIPYAILQGVAYVQEWLNTYFNAGLKVDGKYGPKTKAALVKALQTIIGVTVTGEWNAETANAVGVISETDRNDRSHKVTIWQATLVCVGIDPNGIDGWFGNGCADATEVAQKRMGLKTDKKVGKRTWAAYLG